MTARIVLRPRRARPFFGRHPWVYAGAIAEVVGQPISVTTNGVTNIVTLGPGGQATITSPAGRVVNGTWTAANGQMCLSNGTAQECWPYASPFQAGQPVTVTSSCNSTSTWLAQATNQPPPTQGQRGERGR